MVALTPAFAELMFAAIICSVSEPAMLTVWPLMTICPSGSPSGSVCEANVDPAIRCWRASACTTTVCTPAGAPVAAETDTADVLLQDALTTENALLLSRAAAALCMEATSADTCPIAVCCD